MGLTVATRRHEHQATVTLTGDLDLAAAATVGAAIEAAVHAADADAVVVDLSAVSFLDSSGISVLLRGRRLADEHHLGYRVTGAQGLVLTVLEMTGVWPHLSGQAEP